MSFTRGMPFATGGVAISKQHNAQISAFMLPSCSIKYSNRRLVILASSQSSNESKKATKILRSGVLQATERN